MSRILITGGGGFIGAHLARALAEADHEVDLVDDLSRGQMDADLAELAERPNVSFLQKDLLAPGATDDLPSEYAQIFHLAAIVGVANVLDAPDRVLRRNIELLDVVLDLASRQSRLERLLFASTSEVYAGTLELGDLAVPTPEDSLLILPDLQRPRTSYMLSKIYGEAMVLQSGLPVTVVRPHNVYGPRMGLAHVIPELLQRAHATPDGGRLEVYSVDHRRTFCFVSDAVEMISRASEVTAGRGQVLNVGNQQPEIRHRGPRRARHRGRRAPARDRPSAATPGFAKPPLPRHEPDRRGNGLPRTGDPRGRDPADLRLVPA